MALSKLNFTKNWTNHTDFPTMETREEQVREDIQLLHDETRAAFNKLIDDLAADEIPFSPTEGIDEDNLQDAIENVQAQISGTVTGNLPNGSVTQEKLSTVSSEAGAAVGTNQIEDEAVTKTKLAAALQTEINGNTSGITALQNAMSGKASLEDGIVTRSQLRFRVKSESLDGARVLQTDDMGCIIRVYASGTMANASKFVIPANDTIPAGSFVMILNNRSSGNTIIAPSSGINLYRPGSDDQQSSFALDAHQSVLLIKLSVTRWVAARFA